MTLLLNRQDVESLLTMEATIEAVEGAFRQLALGNTVMPQRTVVKPPEHHGIHLGMPAYIGGDVGGLGLKIVTVYHDNPQKYNLPTTIGVLLLNDPATGAPLSIMDASFLTAMRTGAAGGVAAKHLARKGAENVVIFGAGVQARTQLMAACAVRPINKAMVIDLNTAAREKFAKEMSELLNIPVEPAEDVQAAVEGAGIIVAATSSPEPIFNGAWLQPGVHINGIGSHTPTTRELDTKTLQRAKIVPDLASACLSEAGDIIIPIQEGAISEDDIQTELGQVIAGLKPGRTSDQDITLFKSVGLAIQDISTAVKVYQLALEKGVGQKIQL
ncbi:MAG: ornithine cyclodeaminase family protein [Anaerolineales bacterium]|nr:ornithine cyclodeaminase family protein [Anaerolineales bacterium]